jgi:hypothetical protein
LIIFEKNSGNVKSRCVILYTTIGRDVYYDVFSRSDLRPDVQRRAHVNTHCVLSRDMRYYVQYGEYADNRDFPDRLKLIFSRGYTPILET